MGGKPKFAVEGCPVFFSALEAARKLDVELIFVGSEDSLLPQLAKLGAARDPRFEVVDAKPEGSLMTACELVSSGKAAGVVTAAPAAAAQAAALWHLKRLPGALVAPLASTLSTRTGAAVLLDAGLNSDCKPWHLLQFAAMGSAYARVILKLPKTRVGLLSPNAAPNALSREAAPLLKVSGLDFVGSVDPAAALAGAAEVLVCDGFVGAVALGALRSAQELAFDRVESAGGWRGGMLSRPLEKARAALSPQTFAAQPLLGVGGSMVTCGTDADSAAEALRTCCAMVAENLGDLIKKSIDEVKQNLETSRVNF